MPRSLIRWSLSAQDLGDPKMTASANTSVSKGLIAAAVLAIEMGCVAHDLADVVHPHPTLSETLMNAAEVHFGTATEIYKPKRRAAASS